MDILRFMEENVLLLDGGMGSLLLARGLGGAERPESWVLTHPDAVEEIHRAYYDAGSNVVLTDTFGANRLHFSPEELPELLSAAVRLARSAAESSAAPGEKFVALDVGPLGRLLAPAGDLAFEDAVSLFAETVRLGAPGADLIFIETMNDLAETRAALLAARENSDLPVFVSNAWSPNGRLLTGADPETVVAVAEGMGAAAVGLNCSMPPRELAAVAERVLACATVPVIFKPNAGAPGYVDGQTVYRTGPRQFAADTAALVRRGVRGVGGCCGTTPEHIAALKDALRGMAPVKTAAVPRCRISSDREALILGSAPVVIGDRINPTGRPDLAEDLRAGSVKAVAAEGRKQKKAGAQVLDVNVSVKGVDQPRMLAACVRELQSAVRLPIQIDTVNTTAMERALRAYHGRALVNSVNGRADSMRTTFPMVKKYGGTVICLTLDEQGLPVTVDDRMVIARRILAAAAEYGLRPTDLVFDPLVLSAKSDPLAARTAVETVRAMKAEGLLTMAAVSNVSFGLPGRKALESTFMAMLLEAGADLLLCDPAVRPQIVPEAERALLCGEEALNEYIINNGGYFL